MRRTRLALDFARRFERRFDPICTLPVEPTEEAPVRGMLVSDDARELLPAWAGFCGGVIESDALVPTASREDLQKDDTYEAIARQLRACLVEHLADLPRSSPSTWRRILLRHNESLIGAALSDDRMFDLLADQLKLPTSEGELTVPNIARRSKGRLHVSLGEGSGYEEVLFRAMQVPVVSGVRYGALPFCQRHAERGGLTVVRLGTRTGDAAMFTPADIDDDARARLEALLGRPDQQVVPTRFVPAELPVVLVPDREVALKRRIEQDEADKRISSAILGLARMYTQRIDGSAVSRLYVNLDSPIIRRLVERDGPAEQAAAAIVRALADLMTDRREGLIDVDTGAAFRGLSEALVSLMGPEETA